MATKERVTTATEGSTVALRSGAPHQSQMVEFTIKPKCEEDRGRWLCLTHDKVFWNNFDKDSHIERGTHVMAWFCAMHGPEVP